MKKIGLAVIVSCTLFPSIPVISQTSPAPFTNDICLPSKLYLLSGTQNEIFVEPLLKRWRPYNDVVRFSGTARFKRRLQRVASITAPKDNTTITLSLINQDNFDTIKTITSTIVVGEKGTGSDTITVSILGDSFTNGAFFKDALITSGNVPKLQLIGLRDALDCPGQFDEGRGGWTLDDYFSVSTERTQSYNGFWQPDGNYRYWGSTHFWKLANEVRLHPQNKWTFDERYWAGRFSTCSLLFDTATGYKLKPEVNDVMYDNTKKKYVQFDGSKWKNAAYNNFTWHFNYGKYLSMWKLKAPAVFAEFLGSNDFSNAPYPGRIDFSKWNARIKEVAASYFKAVPNGKFVIMIPPSTSGILDNQPGEFTTKENACIWELRKNIIETFDNKESEKIFLVDAAIAIDNYYGFNFTADSAYTKPYAAYEGKERIAVQTGNSHPYPNYPAMGYSLAAFIQKFR